MDLMNELDNVSTQLHNLKYYSELHFLLTRLSLFYELHHLSRHGLIANITWSVPIAHYCLPC